MSVYRFSNEAQIDLRSLVRYIAQHDAAAAQRVSRAILATIEFLAEQPQAAPLCESIHPGLRIFPARKPAHNFVIAYQIRDDVLLVIGVFHGRRNWPSLIRERSP